MDKEAERVLVFDTKTRTARKPTVVVCRRQIGPITECQIEFFHDW
jgi:hypothetical protein